MKHKLVVDKKRRQLLCQKELKYRLWKSMSVNAYFNSDIRAISLGQLSSKFLYRSRIINYCVITARSKGVLRKFKMSRMFFKYAASNGFINGIKKGSW
jgi:ribosomal protein S14